MTQIKTKSIRGIEQKMEELEPGSIRYNVLEQAKGFKTSWIALGQMLFSVWKDKLYREWGYQQFDSYVSKEIGVRKQTAAKLLRSYSFLEKEEPRYLSRDFVEGAQASSVPTYESVDLLRRANDNKDLDRKDYAKIRKYVLEEGKDASDVRKDLTKMIKENRDIDDEQEKMRRRRTVLKRFVSTLKSVRKEIKYSKVLPQSILQDAERLIERIEAEIT
ncbi:MAG: hypothetical protein GF409_06730 [Candidatus Omnitrophica bacterium]|nr:hypothetical protein [Candidatus Omnitrophota bacterium]